jgi:hypothetical protein
MFTGFSKYSNQIKLVKYEKNTSMGPKNFQTWQSGRFKTDEQLSPLAQLQTPTGFNVINFGTNSHLNLP